MNDERHNRLVRMCEGAKKTDPFTNVDEFREYANDVLRSYKEPEVSLAEAAAAFYESNR